MIIQGLFFLPAGPGYFFCTTSLGSSIPWPIHGATSLSAKSRSAVNNYVIALLTFGEGYHNFHHTFANDYRNGIRWYHLIQPNG